MSFTDRFRLDGKTALVTGARRGIGKAIAVGLAGSGADIIGSSLSMDASGSDVEAEVKAAGRSFTGIACDFSDREATRAFAADPRIADVDILIANAGTIRRAPAEVHSDEDWDHVIEVNLNAQFVLAREVGRRMLERGSGKIVFTASLLTYQGGITVPGYAAAKGAIGQVAKALANEWAGKGVNVNAIAPGYIRTDNTQALQDDPVRSRSILERIPAGRWGEATDLAGAAVFLSSDAASYVHGTVLPVDGGWLGR